MCWLRKGMVAECEWLEFLQGDIADKPLPEPRRLGENVKALRRRSISCWRVIKTAPPL